MRMLAVRSDHDLLPPNVTVNLIADSQSKHTASRVRSPSFTDHQ
jgi:hypothetical protein